MTDTTKTEDTKTADAKTAAPGAAAKPLALGDVVRLRAVHGYIQNPFTLDGFDTDTEKKVVADAWTLVQVKAEKLIVTE